MSMIYELPEVVSAMKKADSMERNYEEAYAVYLGQPWKEGDIPRLFVKEASDPVANTIEIYNTDDGKLL